MHAQTSCSQTWSAEDLSLGFDLKPLRQNTSSSNAFTVICKASLKLSTCFAFAGRLNGQYALSRPSVSPPLARHLEFLGIPKPHACWAMSTELAVHCSKLPAWPLRRVLRNLKGPPDWSQMAGLGLAGLLWRELLSTP